MIMKILKKEKKKLIIVIIMIIVVISMAFKINEKSQFVNEKILTDIEPTPFSIVFMGIDNEIDSIGSDKITLMLVRELKSGESFSITNGIYHKKDSLHSTSYWTSAIENQNISSQQITYTGGATLPPGTIICGEVPGEGTGEQLLINNLSINGEPADEMFEVTNNGLNVNPDLDIKTDKWGAYYIYQGEFFKEDGEAKLLGTIIDGIAMGISQRNLEAIGIPPELGVGTDISVIDNTGSNYVYVLCDGVLYKCEIEVNVKDWGKWNRYEGTNGDDMTLEEICDMLCGVSDCNGILDIEIDTSANGSEELCDYGVCLMQFGVPTGFINDIHVALPDGTEQDLNGEPEFHFNYYGNQSSYICDLADDVQNWLDDNGYPGTAYMSSSYSAWNGSCRGLGTCNFLVIEGTNVDFIYVVGQEDDVNDPIQYEYFVESNCGFSGNEDGTTLIAEIDNCGDPEYLWSTDETTQSIVVDNPGWYFVTVTCGDTCEYVDSILISPTQNSLEPRNAISSSKLELTVFPNPAQSEISISIGVEVKEKYTLEITDAIGKPVKSIDVVFGVGNNIITININAIPPGVYNLRVLYKPDYKTAKFTKIK